MQLQICREAVEEVIEERAGASPNHDSNGGEINPLEDGVGDLVPVAEPVINSAAPQAEDP